MRASQFLFKQGTISSVITVLLLFLSLIFVTWQIQVLGIELNGLLVLLLSIFGTINLLNIGIGSAIITYYSKFGEDKSVFWSIFIASFFFLIVFSGIIALITLPFYETIYRLLNVGDHGLTLLSFIGLTLIGISRLLSTIISSYWVATCEFLKLKIFGFASFYLSIVLILLFFESGYNLDTSFFYSGIGNIIFIMCMFIHIIVTSTSTKNINIQANTRKYLKDFLKNGFDFQAIAIINNLFNPIINTFINNTFGLATVSLFDIALRLLRAGRQVLVSATEPIFSKSTQLSNNKKYLLIHLLTLKYTKIMIVLSIIYFFTTLLLSKIILSIWLGEEIAESSYNLVNIIAFGFAINIATSVIYNRYLAEQKTRKYILIHQILLILLPVLPFVLPLNTIIQYAYYFSVAFGASSFYLLFIYLNKSKT